MFELYVDGVQDMTAQYFANPAAVSTVVLTPSASTLAVMGMELIYSSSWVGTSLFWAGTIGNSPSKVELWVWSFLSRVLMWRMF